MNSINQGIQGLVSDQFLSTTKIRGLYKNRIVACYFPINIIARQNYQSRHQINRTLVLVSILIINKLLHTLCEYANIL